MKSNFSFLREKFSNIANNASIAEKCLYTDTHNSIIKFAIICEILCRLICEKSDIHINEKENFRQVVYIIKKYQLLYIDDIDTIDKIIKIRNRAAHSFCNNVEAAEYIFSTTYSLSCNFYRNYIDKDYIPDQFIALKKPPYLTNKGIDLENLILEIKRKMAMPLALGFGFGHLGIVAGGMAGMGLFAYKKFKEYKMKESSLPQPTIDYFKNFDIDKL